MAQRAQLLQYLQGQRPRKLFNILNRLEKFGVGRKATRVIWKQEQQLQETMADFHPCYWTITRVVPSKDLKRGRVWGVLTWKGRGTGEERERRVRSPLKPHWKLLPRDQ